MNEAKHRSSPEGRECLALPDIIHCPRKSRYRLEAKIRCLVEGSAVADLQLGAMEAGVTRHHCSRSIIEAHSQCILKRVADELGAIGIHDLEGLYASDDGVLLETIILRPPRLHHVGRIGPEVRVGIVPGQQRGSA